MITSKTSVCCIIGNPVEHSPSPQVHNAGYKALGLNFVFVSFRVGQLQTAIAGLGALGIRGIVVTIPHKIEVIKYVNELDDAAKAIGAVNTIVNDSGVLKGTNTDWIGGIYTIKKFLASKGETFRGKNVALLGAGGAARAVAYGLKKEGAIVCVFNRTIERAQTLVQMFQLEKAYELSEKEAILKADIIINATSLGMEPNSNTCAITEDCIRREHIVYDIVSVPKETKLLLLAQKKGARVVFGYKMLLHGAIPQFELFTGQKAPIDVMEKALHDALERKK